MITIDFFDHAKELDLEAEGMDLADQLIFLERLGRITSSAEPVVMSGHPACLNHDDRTIQVTKDFSVFYHAGRLLIKLSNAKFFIWLFTQEQTIKYVDVVKPVRRVLEQDYTPFATREELEFEIAEFVEDYLS